MEIWHLVLIGIGVLITIIGSVTIPIMVFMSKLRPFVKDTVGAELSEFKGNVEGRLGRIEGRLDEIGAQTRIIPDLILRLKGNPDGRREELLERWKQGILTYNESTELRDILAHEAEQAEESKKVMVALGLIALLLYGLSRKD